MGMFDTFWGDYKCDHCGNIVHFEEQTKDYELILADYLLGDYCDKGNANYYYEFESYCPECHQKHNVRIAIRRGQYVGIYMDYEAAEIPIENLDNIEDGYLRNIHKKQRYENKLGEAEEADIKAFGKNHHVGDKVQIFGLEWEIDEIYKSEKVLFERDWIYRVHSDNLKRIVVGYDQHLIRPERLYLYLDDFGEDFIGELKKRPNVYFEDVVKEKGYVAYMEQFSYSFEIEPVDVRKKGEKTKE